MCGSPPTEGIGNPGGWRGVPKVPKAKNLKEMYEV